MSELYLPALLFSWIWTTSFWGVIAARLTRRLEVPGMSAALVGSLPALAFGAPNPLAIVLALPGAVVAYIVVRRIH